MPKERVTITIDDELLARIDTLAEKQGLTRSALVELLLADGVVEEELIESPEVQGTIAAITSPDVVEMLGQALREAGALDELQERAVSRAFGRIRRMYKSAKRKPK